MPVLPTFATQLSAPSRRLRRPKTKRPATLTWPAHLISLAVLLLAYAAGYSNGRDASLSAAITAHQNHPAYHPNLKP